MQISIRIKYGFSVILKYKHDRSNQTMSNKRFVSLEEIVTNEERDQGFVFIDWRTVNCENRLQLISSGCESLYIDYIM